MATSPAVLLFVEDEVFLHDLVEPALEDAGFVVAAATSSEEAMRLLTQRRADFCALVTDIDLGRGPSGWEIARLARQLIADIPVVYASGGSAHRFDAERVPRGVMVTKPYMASQIVTAVELVVRQRKG